MEQQTSTPISRQATARDLVAVIFRQKWIILTIFAVTTVSVFLFNLRSPTTYESSSRILVKRGRLESTQDTGPRLLAWQEEISSELETIKSYPVSRMAQEILDGWLESGELTEPVRLNRGGISAGVIGESNVLEISYTSNDAAACRPVTDAITVAYTDFRRQAFSIPGAEDFFTREIDRVEVELQELEARKSDYLASLGEFAYRGRDKELGALLNDNQRERLSVQRDLSVAEHQLSVARRIVEDGGMETAFFLQLKFENMATLNGLRDRVNLLQVARDERAATLTPNHPDYRAAEDALQSAKALLDAEILSTVDLLEARRDELRGTLAKLEDQSAELGRLLASIPETDLQLARLDQLIADKQKEFSDLKGKEVLTRVNRATSPDFTVTLLSPASAPYAKKTRDYVRMSLAPLMSLVVGFLLAFFLDSLDHSLRNPADVEEFLGLPVLAAIPESRR